MKKLLYIMGFVYIIVLIGMGINLLNSNHLSKDLSSTILVGYVGTYNAPIGYYEYYISQNKGLNGKYDGYNLGRFNIPVANSNTIINLK